jgi:chitinase
MHFTIILAGLGIMASVASARPHKTLSSRQSPGAQNVVYWGQNGGGIVENNDLSVYCTSTSGVDIIVLAFLYSYGNGNNIPSGTIGQSCFISTSGEGQDCTNIQTSIPICQAAGIKVILSLGGASGSYSLQSDAEAETIGQYLWDSYANSGNTAVERPFGDSFVNGFDFDIELNDGFSQFYPSMISTLRSNFASDPDNTYYITGAPQCPIPEPNMGVIIGNSTFDYLWVQFYNNNNGWPSLPNTTFESCSLGFNGNAPFNYNQWVDYLATTPSADAKLFIGMPAAPLGANGLQSGETYYITPVQLAELVEEYHTNSAFGGLMMWSAGFSDSNVIDGCTYAQQGQEILLTGAPCDGTVPTSPLSTHSLSATATPTSTGTSATGTVGAYDQCGGTGYTGSTTCISGYVCTEISSAYSQCDPS